jgi:hypothetical protein
MRKVLWLAHTDTGTLGAVWDGADLRLVPVDPDTKLDATEADIIAAAAAVTARSGRIAGRNVSWMAWMAQAGVRFTTRS